MGLHKDMIFAINSEAEFNDAALAMFDDHYKNNEVYREFVSLIYPGGLKDIAWWKDIPCMPVSFFKTHNLYTSSKPAETVFYSSGTSGTGDSRHAVDSLDHYHRVCSKAFSISYGSPEKYAFLCLLPSYLERKGSSLIEMCLYFIDQSGKGGFFLDDHQKLLDELTKHRCENTPVILLGVSFALLDFAETKPDASLFKGVTIMETGGMKGRRREITRMELHETLCTAFGQEIIASEYGMTELMSQAYAAHNGIFTPPPWMRLYTRHPGDPMSAQPPGKTGLLNIIDLANSHSMPFISADDIGIVYDNTTFVVLGRFDRADIRGCNLMVF
jgi:hypothetical protein